MIYIFRCPPVNNLIVTEEEPYKVAGVYAICDECYYIALDGSS